MAQVGSFTQDHEGFHAFHHIVLWRRRLSAEANQANYVDLRRGERSLQDRGILQDTRVEERADKRGGMDEVLYEGSQLS